MPLEKATAIGLTGSFGSGCSTIAEALAETFKEKRANVYSLSYFVKKQWDEGHPGKNADFDAPRSELQDIGNKLREIDGDGCLATKAIRQAEQEGEERELLVFDSIRHLAEIGELNDHFKKFLLIAINSPRDLRWERVKEKYFRLKLTEDHFDTDDERDKNEEGKPHGQQVQLCVDKADVLINNDEKYLTREITKNKLREKVLPFISLFEGETIRPPEPDEYFMSLAYQSMLISKCYKRQVGAVIVCGGEYEVLGTGFNSIPKQIGSCDEKFGKCYRDIYTEKFFEDLSKKVTYCPVCNRDLPQKLSEPYKCPSCELDLYKFYIRDKALSRCTSIHAEDNAIRAATGKDLRESVLYTTTFPCLMCAMKILHVRIRKVVYTEPYTDKDSEEILRNCGVELHRFQGVKGELYTKLFSEWRRRKEEEISKRFKPSST